MAALPSGTSGMRKGLKGGAPGPVVSQPEVVIVKGRAAMAA